MYVNVLSFLHFEQQPGRALQNLFSSFSVRFLSGMKNETAMNRRGSDGADHRVLLYSKKSRQILVHFRLCLLTH